jgi:hypothetical protein
VHSVDPQTLAPEGKTEKYILRRLTDAENVIENEFKAEAEVSREKRLGPSAPRCPCSFGHEREGTLGPRPVGTPSNPYHLNFFFRPT